MGDTTLLSFAPTGTFDGEPYLASLRGKDPRRTATTTMHVAQRATDNNARAPGVRSHHFGPGVKLTGGQLTYCQEDRAEGRVRVPRSLDPEEILQAYRTQQAETAAAKASKPVALSTSAVQSARGEAVVQPRRGLTSSNSQHTGVHKLVYFDGTKHHVIDKPQGSADDWKPPHLEQKDLAPGPLLGVVEVGGAAGTKLVASKHRLMATPDTPLDTMLPGTNLARQPMMTGPLKPPFKATEGPYGLAPFAPLEQTSSFGEGGNINEGTLREYAQTKTMGHREYEATCKAMDGMQSWRDTGLHMVTPMHHEHGWTSTRMVAPKEHMEARQSLRRSS